MGFIKTLKILTEAMSNFPMMANGYLHKFEPAKFMDDEEYNRLQTLNHPDIYCLKQQWSSTDCGWGGIGGSAFTWSDVIVFCLSRYDIAFVYINRFAYICEMDEEFQKCLDNKKFPGYAYSERSPLKILEKAYTKTTI